MTIDAYLNKDAKSIVTFMEFAVSFCEEQCLDISSYLSIAIPDTELRAEYLISVVIHGKLHYILFRYKKGNYWGVYRLNFETRKGEFVTDAIYKKVVPENAYLLLQSKKGELKALLLGSCLFDAEKVAYAILGNHVFVTVLLFSDRTFIGHWYELGEFEHSEFIFESFEDFCNLVSYRFIHQEMRGFFANIKTTDLQDFMCSVGSCIPSAFSFKENAKNDYIKYI